VFCFARLVFTYSWVKSNGHSRDKCLPQLPVVVSLSFFRFYGEEYLDNLSLLFVNAVAELGEITKSSSGVLYYVTRIKQYPQRERILQDSNSGR
jgi:hypothetical protein